MCGTFCQFAKPSRGNNVATFVLLCFLVSRVNLADILLVALATFVVYTNVRRSVRRLILALRNHLANIRWNSARQVPWCLWCLLKGEIHPNYLPQLKYWKPLSVLNRQCLCWFLHLAENMITCAIGRGEYPTFSATLPLRSAANT
jgi:hypothetical protein